MVVPLDLGRVVEEHWSKIRLEYIREWSDCFNVKILNFSGMGAQYEQQSNISTGERRR
jgi:hypothetical protein